METQTTMLTDNQLRQVNALQTKALLVGVVCTVVALIGAIVYSLGEGVGLRGLFQPFMVAYVWVLGLGLGGLALVMLHHLCGGAWSFMIQRIGEAASRTLPFLFVLGILVVLCGALFSFLYPWRDPAHLELYPIVKNKLAFLNLGTFTVCFFLYWAIWMALMFVFNGWSKKLDKTGDVAIIGRMQALAAPGLILYVLSLTFASTHWFMSLEPEWFSTIYGAWAIAGFSLSIMSFSAIVLTYLAQEGPVASAVTDRHYHHIGNFLLGFTIFWAYVSFSQFLIIWNGNLPEEIGYYLHRSGGGLTEVTVLLIVLVWLVPFFGLLLRHNKTNPKRLRNIAFMVIFVRLIDLYWNIVPSFDGHHSVIRPLMVALVLLASAGFMGLWLWVFLGQLKKMPVLPQQDPRREFNFLKDEAHSHA